ncbi:MAG: LysM peptidoglycan-binding domain-containing protein [Caldilineales bacterium]|nr:LysM peptidoglycan-binding domain-containing protein [Caldilineales bacterium]MDW8318322.1 LysM peptidoglycan-binding domain-containing protein [Anaerolineae bacterium]
MAIEKATLTPLDANGKPDLSRQLKVQFNPETLRISRRRFGSGGAQSANPDRARQASTQQITGHGATMSVELLFDTSQEKDQDVMKITGQIAALVGSGEAGSTAATRVRFQWGSFIFTGVIESMDETIDLFSESGFPLRSTVTLSLTEGQITSEARGGGGLGAGAGLGLGASAGVSAGVGFSAGISAGVSAGVGFSAGAAVGTQPLTLAQAGDTLQSLAGRAGLDWKAVAAANGVENPRRLPTGAVLNLNVKAST